MPAVGAPIGIFDPIPPGAHPVDYLIARKLEQRGLRASDEADRRTLARRLSFDLVGLPPTPDEVDYCAKPGAFGPHNLHENRKGSLQSSTLIFATYHNAGVRAFDISDPFRPVEVGHYVPPDPAALVDPRPNRPLVIQSTDVFVDSDGVMFLTDKNAGLNILQFDGL